MALTASPEAQALLLELQAADTRVQQLAHRASKLAEHARLTELAGEAEQVRQRWLEQQGAVEDARRELQRVQSDTELVEARIARNTERLATTSSPKDAAALEHEMETLRRRRDDLDEIQLGAMETLEEREAAANESREALDRVTAEIARTEADRDAQLAEIARERESALGSRQELAGRIPHELVSLYERQRERYGIGASHLRGGVSSASGVRLNESDMAAIRKAAPDEVIICPDSDAILVRTAESGL